MAASRLLSAALSMPPVKASAASAATTTTLITLTIVADGFIKRFLYRFEPSIDELNITVSISPWPIQYRLRSKGNRSGVLGPANCSRLAVARYWNMRLRLLNRQIGRLN
jgi:hypothetical protein